MGPLPPPDTDPLRNPLEQILRALVEPVKELVAGKAMVIAVEQPTELGQVMTIYRFVRQGEMEAAGELPAFAPFTVIKGKEE